MTTIKFNIIIIITISRCGLNLSTLGSFHKQNFLFSGHNIQTTFKQYSNTKATCLQLENSLQKDWSFLTDMTIRKFIKHKLSCTVLAILQPGGFPQQLEIGLLTPVYFCPCNSVDYLMILRFLFSFLNDNWRWLRSYFGLEFVLVWHIVYI